MIKWKWKSQKNSWAQNRRRRKKYIDSRQFLTSIRSSSLMWLKGNKFLWFRYTYFVFFLPFSPAFHSLLRMLTCVHSSFSGNRQEELISLHPMGKALLFCECFFFCWFWYFHIEKFPYAESWTGNWEPVWYVLYVIHFYMFLHCYRFDVHIFFPSVLFCFVFVVFDMFSFSKSE